LIDCNKENYAGNTFAVGTTNTGFNEVGTDLYLNNFAIVNSYQGITICGTSTEKGSVKVTAKNCQFANNTNTDLYFGRLLNSEINFENVDSRNSYKFFASYYFENSNFKASGKVYSNNSTYILYPGLMRPNVILDFSELTLVPNVYSGNGNIFIYANSGASNVLIKMPFVDFRNYSDSVPVVYSTSGESASSIWVDGLRATRTANNDSATKTSGSLVVVNE